MRPSRPFALVACIAMLALASAACNDAGSDTSTGARRLRHGVPRAHERRRPGAPTDSTSSSSAPARGGPTSPGSALDGSGESAPLTDFGDGAQTNPDWSPDGTRIVFAMIDGTTDDLFVADAGSARGHASSSTASRRASTWTTLPGHRTASRIVYSRTVDRDGAAVSTLETVEVATGEVQRAARTRGPSSSPPGPDGPRTDARIVFEMVYEDRARARGRPLRRHAVRPASGLDVRHSAQRHRPGASSRPTASPIRRCSRRPPTGAPTAGGSSTPPSPAPEDEAPDLFRDRRAWAAPAQRLTQLVDEGGYAAEPTFTPDGDQDRVQRWPHAPTRTDLLLQVRRRTGPDSALATGDVEVHGRHPRVRCGPQRRVNANAS